MLHHPDKVGLQDSSRNGSSSGNKETEYPNVPYLTLQQNMTNANINIGQDAEVIIMQNLPQPVVERQVYSPERPQMDAEDLELSPPPRPTGPPKLWDATAITIQSSEMSTPVKVKLEANLVRDSGYV